jgi:hypothetical protein
VILLVFVAVPYLVNTLASSLFYPTILKALLENFKLERTLGLRVAIFMFCQEASSQCAVCRQG